MERREHDLMGAGRALLALLAVVCGLLAGCSSYSVRHQEIAADGASYTIEIAATTAPGGVQEMLGRVKAGVSEDGSWQIEISGGGASDATRTAELIETASREAFQAGIAAMAAAAGVPPLNLAAPDFVGKGAE